MSFPNTIEIHGGVPLRGEVSCGGSKNVSLPLLAAALAAPRRSILRNLSEAQDVLVALDIVRSVGAQVELSENSVSIDPTRLSTGEVPVALGSKIRPSYYFLPPLLNKVGSAFLPWPGGCSIGDRPIDLHLTYLREVGVSIEEREEGIFFEYRRPESPRDMRFDLPFPSRGVTIGLLLLSSFGNLNVEINNANLAVETLHTVRALRSHGATIDIEPGRIRVTASAGSPSGPDPVIDVAADKIEAAFFEVAGILTNGAVDILNPPMDDLAAFHGHLERMGFAVEFEDGRARARSNGRNGAISPIVVEPGLENDSLDADFEPILFVLATLAHGRSVMSDDINPGRHENFIPFLRQAGMEIDVLTPTKASITGPRPLRNFDGRALDIRSGSALILAALAAEGKSVISGLGQVRRGYAGLLDKISSLSGRIEYSD